MPSADPQGHEARAELVVEEAPDSLLLKLAPTFAETQFEDVFASLSYSGMAKTIKEMDAGVLAEAKRRTR